MKFRQIVELQHLRGDFIAIGTDGELYALDVNTDVHLVVATKFRVDVEARDPFGEEDPE